MPLHTKALPDVQGFTIAFHAEIEQDLDLSFDETGDTQRNLDTGHWVVFCAHVEVSKEGIVLSNQYLSNCIYASYECFYNSSGYLEDMINEGIDEAKEVIKRLTK